METQELMLRWIAELDEIIERLPPPHTFTTGMARQGAENERARILASLTRLPVEAPSETCYATLADLRLVSWCRDQERRTAMERLARNFERPV